jgi:hypothetical protein
MWRSVNKLAAGKIALLLAGGFSLAASSAAGGQLGELPVDGNAVPEYVRALSPIVGHSDDEVRSHLASVTFQSLSPEETDDLYLLVKTRPAVAVPVLAYVLRSGLAGGSMTPAEVAQVVDVG